MATPKKFSDDPLLIELGRQLDKVEARLSERRDEAVDEANFADWSVKYMDIQRLEEQRIDLNRRYQQRRQELQGRSLVFGRYLKHEPGNPTDRF